MMSSNRLTKSIIKQRLFKNAFLDHCNRIYCRVSIFGKNGLNTYVVDLKDTIDDNGMMLEVSKAPDYVLTDCNFRESDTFISSFRLDEDSKKYIVDVNLGQLYTADMYALTPKIMYRPNKMTVNATGPILLELYKFTHTNVNTIEPFLYSASYKPGTDEYENIEDIIYDFISGDSRLIWSNQLLENVELYIMQNVTSSKDKYTRQNFDLDSLSDIYISPCTTGSLTNEKSKKEYMYSYNPELHILDVYHNTFNSRFDHDLFLVNGGNAEFILNRYTREDVQNITPHFRYISSTKDIAVCYIGEKFVNTRTERVEENIDTKIVTLKISVFNRMITNVSLKEDDTELLNYNLDCKTIRGDEYDLFNGILNYNDQDIVYSSVKSYDENMINSYDSMQYKIMYNYENGTNVLVNSNSFLYFTSLGDLNDENYGGAYYTSIFGTDIKFPKMDLRRM